MEKVTWTDPTKKIGLLRTVKLVRNIVHTVERREGEWVGEALRRNYLLKRVIDGKIEGGKKEDGVSSYWMTLMIENIPDLERERTRSHYMKNRLLGEAVDLS
jgi:hypothetical protein